MKKKIISYMLVISMLAVIIISPVYAYSDESESGSVEERTYGESSEDESRGESAEGESSGESSDIEMDVTDIVTETGSEYMIYSNERSIDSREVAIILIPDGMDTDEFLELTEWEYFAGTTGYYLIVLSYDWSGDEQSATQYFEEVFSDLENSLISMDDAVFLIGYEEGADFVRREVCSNSIKFTGIVAFGGIGLTADQIDEYEESENINSLSIWLINDDSESVTDEEISFWKNINNIGDKPYNSYQAKFADECYLPVTSSASNITGDSNNMGMLLISSVEDFYTSSITADITGNFITKVKRNEIRFIEGITGGETFRINDWHFTYYRRQYEGQQRDYWLYVPDPVRNGDEAYSMVVCLHGNGGNGQDMIFRSQWHETAAENNCIVLYPSSLYKIGVQHYWQNIDEEIDYLLDIIEHICVAYGVDRSRIYITGYSNGAGMAQNLAVKCSSIFAAAVMGAPVYYDSEYYGPPEDVHEVAVFFSSGDNDPYLEEYDTSVEIDDTPALEHMEYWRNMYGFEQDEYEYEETDIFRIYTFFNDDRIPVCKWMIVSGKGHTYPKEEIDTYYDFMKAYTKGENGELYYNGEPVNSRPH